MKWCDECKYFEYYTEGEWPKKEYKYLCKKEHAMSFKIPKDCISNDWGFYKKGCKDRAPR